MLRSTSLFVALLASLTLGGAACAPTGSPDRPAPAGPLPTPTTLAAPAGSPASTDPTPAELKDISGSPTMAGPFDQQFIDMMVPHHEGALEMARIAEPRAEPPEIRALAADILRTQAAEIELLRRWRKEWYGSDQTPPLNRMPMVEGMVMPATGGHAGHGAAVGDPLMTMDMAADVEALRQAPEPFDPAFIDLMIAHHEDAVAAAQAAEHRAQRPEIRELAQTIIRDQEQEIAQMRAWRQAWFGSATPETGR